MADTNAPILPGGCRTEGVSLPVLEIGREYYWTRTPGWDWFGTWRWWEVFIVPLGWDGGGGVWAEERWRWNGSANTLRRTVDSLSAGETLALMTEISEALRG